jgi:general secretion pathway protein K
MLVAIMLVALGTILAASVAYRSAMTARRGTATISFDEALLVGQGAEALAAYGLKTVMQSTKSSSGATSPDVYATQAWAEPVGPLEVVPGVTLEASLEDMQGRFNLNWLVHFTSASNPAELGQPDKTAVEAFKALLELTQVDPNWADKVVDWIDRDNQVGNQGAEDSVYLGQNPPYLTANQPITSTSELLALPGFGRDNYAKLAPYISALPPNSSLNICTAKDKVLDAFTYPTVNYSDPTALQKNRASAPGCFPGLNGFKASFDKQKAPAAQDRFTTTSNYFRLSSLVTIGTAEFNLYSLLYMNSQQGYFINTLQRSFSPD